MSGRASSTQASAILNRHARDDIAPLRLQELCRDNDRVSSLVSVYNATPERMLLADLSRQRMTSDTLNHLIRLGNSRQLQKYIARLSWGGKNDPDNPINPQPNKDNRGSSNRQATRFEAISKAVTSATSSSATTGKSRHDHASDNHPTDDIPSFHISLRVPSGEGYQMLDSDGTNVLTKIHRDWERIKQVAEHMRRGQLLGVTGGTFRDVVVVGRGVSLMALRFVYMALLKDEAGNMARRAGLVDKRRGATAYSQRRIKFLTSCDPIRAAAIVADCDPASTVVISISLTGTEETNLATQTLRTWLVQNLGKGLRPDVVLSKHVILVTANEKLATVHKAESFFRIPQHSRCEAFTSFSVATILPLSIVFGWPLVQEFLKGGHNMDCHFVETNPRHNLPILLALTDIWNEVYLKSSGRLVAPYTEALAAYPAFCACLESQACSNPEATTAPSMVVDGGLHSIYDRMLYHSGRSMPTELVMTLDTQISANASGTIGTSNASAEIINESQDALMCSLFAHADELAFGNESATTTAADDDEGGAGGSIDIASDGPEGNAAGGRASNGEDGEAGSDGNRPSTVLVCSRCDAFMCGQFVALAEHRAIVKARVLDVDPFSRQMGSSPREQRLDSLREELRSIMAGTGEEYDDDGVEVGDNDSTMNGNGGSSMNLSTRTILTHYANIMREQRAYANASR